MKAVRLLRRLQDVLFLPRRRTKVLRAGKKEQIYAILPDTLCIGQNELVFHCIACFVIFAYMFLRLYRKSARLFIC